ncbi:hypothetical protein CTI12_AA513430 [Artemisia annua]|uniref:Uncharacterized protein n=1 Tax=Artemisia annua TaxID=35608 RepID=A0A2U1LAD5_ARTAN|nr:hypothetical protein CTI12_AA513430 [Artemisia annua]
MVRYHVEVSVGFAYPDSGAKTSPERRAETKVAMNSDEGYRKCDWCTKNRRISPTSSVVTDPVHRINPRCHRSGTPDGHKSDGRYTF